MSANPEHQSINCSPKSISVSTRLPCFSMRQEWRPKYNITIYKTIPLLQNLLCYSSCMSCIRASCVPVTIYPAVPPVIAASLPVLSSQPFWALQCPLNTPSSCLIYALWASSVLGMLVAMLANWPTSHSPLANFHFIWKPILDLWICMHVHNDGLNSCVSKTHMLKSIKAIRFWWGHENISWG